MTILFAGGEMGAFIPSDATAIEVTTLSGTTASDLYDPAFARCAVTASTTATYCQSFTFAQTADIWIHADLRQYGSLSDSSTLITALTCLNSAGAEVFRLRTGYTEHSTSTYTWQFQYNLSGTWTDIGSSFTTSGARQTLDLHIVANSASGSLNAYVSGTNRVASGTVNLSSIAGVAKIRNYGAGDVRSGGDYVGMSQVIIADESTIGMRLFTVPLSGAGASSDWTGAYTEIDEAIYNDADFINSASVNQVSTFAISAPVLTGYAVRAVVVTARANCGASGPQHLQLALRSAGTNYFTSSQVLDPGYGAFVGIWETNPATSAAFATSSIAALQPGVKSIT